MKFANHSTTLSLFTAEAVHKIRRGARALQQVDDVRCCRQIDRRPGIVDPNKVADRIRVDMLARVRTSGSLIHWQWSRTLIHLLIVSKSDTYCKLVLIS